MPDTFDIDVSLVHELQPCRSKMEKLNQTIKFWKNTQISHEQLMICDAKS